MKEIDNALAQLKCAHKLILLYSILKLKDDYGNINRDQLLNSFIGFYRLRISSGLMDDVEYCNSLQNGDRLKILNTLRKNPLRVLIRTKVLRNIDKMEESFLNDLIPQELIVLADIEKRLKDYFIDHLKDNDEQINTIMEKWKSNFKTSSYILDNNSEEIFDFSTLRTENHKGNDILIFLKKQMNLFSKFKELNESIDFDKRNSIKPIKETEGLEITREIEITQPTFRQYARITFKRSERSFFPGYKVKFTMRTDVGDLECKVSSGRKGTEIGDLEEGNYITGDIGNFYDAHPEIKVGDFLVFSKLADLIYEVWVKK